MRIVQGFAGGLISPQISGLIQSLFRGEERGKAFGYFGTTIGVSTAVGPLTGGALIALFGVHDGWRAVFFVNLPIGAAILLLARRYLPAPTQAERRSQALDPLGVVLLGAAVVCILVALIEQRTWDSPLRLALFPLAAALLVVWVLHERRYGRTREPLVSLDLFQIRSYALGAPVGLLYFAGFIAMTFASTWSISARCVLLSAYCRLMSTRYAVTADSRRASSCAMAYVKSGCRCTGADALSTT
jgi:MFS family permease